MRAERTSLRDGETTELTLVYGIEDLLTEPYRRTLPPLLDGTHESDVLASNMPADMFKILRADFQADFRTNANNSLRCALSDNNYIIVISICDERS